MPYMVCGFCGGAASPQYGDACLDCIAEYNGRQGAGRCLVCGEAPAHEGKSWCAACLLEGGKPRFRNFPGSA